MLLGGVCGVKGRGEGREVCCVGGQSRGAPVAWGGHGGGGDSEVLVVPGAGGGAEGSSGVSRRETVGALQRVAESRARGPEERWGLQEFWQGPRRVRMEPRGLLRVTCPSLPPTRPQPPSGCWCCRPPVPSPQRCPPLRPWRTLPLGLACPQNPDLPPPQDLPGARPLRGPTTTCSLTPRASPTLCWRTGGLRGSPGPTGLRLRKSATAAPCAPGSSSTCLTCSDTVSPTRR